ncbi:cytochrome c oxidase subunit II [Halolamina litorea]|uniref:cytochrome-c oxidase n=1 Tax=Halolamina litorea TaxID=1515593 RepID=A0ABD6BQU8_9EURY|nr:cytochrome c oxidase subunit II [Halolamina litorea]
MRSPGPRRRRALLVTLVVLVVAVDPALAGPTTTADLINELRYKLLIIAIPVTIVAEAALYYAIKTFRNNDTPKPTLENRRLELTWTLGTAAILLFVGFASYGVMAQPSVVYPADKADADGDDVVVDVDAYQWGWEFNYPRHENVSTDTKVVLPVDTRVFFSISSRDVVHSFSVPEMGLKQDAFPGEENVIMTQTTEQGTYQGYCTEFCGVSHAKMTFTVEVMGQQEYQNWLGDQEQRPATDES